MKDKALLRAEMKGSLGQLDRKDYIRWSTVIHSRLFSSDEWRQSHVIALTISRFPEVDTKPIVEQAWNEGKKVAVPKCFPQDKSMKFYFLEDFSQLETVYFGLKEPIVSQVQVCQKGEIDLMLVPGLLFDKKGYRIGFGGGYYDRYLVEFEGSKVSLAFAGQLKTSVPVDEYDIPVHKIITNEGEYDCITRE